MIIDHRCLSLGCPRLAPFGMGTPSQGAMRWIGRRIAEALE
jgi:hypothetical protein